MPKRVRHDRISTMTGPKISAIAAIDEKRGLGKNNELLFKISEDLKRFKELTLGHPIIMGRKTYDSIGRPLPNRINIVITRDEKFFVHHVVTAHSLDEALETAKDREVNEIFVIGGGQIFANAMPKIDRLYLSVVKGNYNADVFFPDYSDFKKVIHHEEREADGYTYTYMILER